MGNRFDELKREIDIMRILFSNTNVFDVLYTGVMNEIHYYDSCMTVMNRRETVAFTVSDGLIGQGDGLAIAWRPEWDYVKWNERPFTMQYSRVLMQLLAFNPNGLAVVRDIVNFRKKTLSLSDAAMANPLLHYVEQKFKFHSSYMVDFKFPQDDSEAFRINYTNPKTLVKGKFTIPYGRFYLDKNIISKKIV